jgi:hypothetical protein
MFGCFSEAEYSAYLSRIERADERTRTADLHMAKDFWCKVKRKRSGWPCSWSDSVIR